MMILRSIALLATLHNCVDAFFVSDNNRFRDLSLRDTPKKDEVETLRKKEFVSIMAEELGYTKTDAEAALTCALDIISDVGALIKFSFKLQIVSCRMRWPRKHREKYFLTDSFLFSCR